MKRYIACLLLLGMLLIATTGCSTPTNNDVPTKEDIHENLKVVFDEICSVYDDCRELAGAFSEHDIGGKWFKACFEDYDVNKKIYNDDFKTWVTGNRQLISSIPNDMEAANNHLKEYSDYSDDDYCTAIKDLSPQYPRRSWRCSQAKRMALRVLLCSTWTTAARFHKPASPICGIWCAAGQLIIQTI